MPAQAATGFRLWYNDLALHTQASAFASPLTVTVADVTNFDSNGNMERLPGLGSQAATVTGFTDTVAVDDTLHIPPAVARMSFNKDANPTVGDIARSFEIVRSSYEWGGTVGEPTGLTVEFQSKDQTILQGNVLHSGITTATGDGTGFDFGTVAAGETLYVPLHVELATVAGTSPTLDVVWERDIDINFSTPTTLFTFAQITASANTFQVATVAGAQTETFHRLVHTIGGTGGPTFNWFSMIAKATV